MEKFAHLKVNGKAHGGLKGQQLGLCYRHGDGTVCSEPEAVKWYRKAAVQDFAKARQALAGFSIPKRAPRASPVE